MDIKINLDKCSECHHFKSSPYPTHDSFERPEYWWCMADDETAPNEDAERVRLGLKLTDKLENLKYIAGYVEWNDKIPIPEWCPNKLK